MNALERIDKKDLRDVLSKGWLTHDAMWFVHAANTLGMDTANRLNLAAVEAMSGFEVTRMKKAFGYANDHQLTFAELISFIESAMDILLTDRSLYSLTVPRPGVMRWEWIDGKCFAYQGLKRVGLLDGYECGVMRRIFTWIELLGFSYAVEPEVAGCLMRDAGVCSGEITISSRG